MVGGSVAGGGVRPGALGGPDGGWPGGNINSPGGTAIAEELTP